MYPLPANRFLSQVRLTGCYGQVPPCTILTTKVHVLTFLCYLQQTATALGERRSVNPWQGGAVIPWSA